MDLLVLSHFDSVIGPRITYALRFDNSRAPAKIPKDMQMQIQKLMDNQIDEGFFSHSIKNYMTANFYFKIKSPWARGNWDLLCLSVITRSGKPELFKDTLEAAVVCLKAIPELYKVFHGESPAENEDFEEKRLELKEFLVSLCQDLRYVENQAFAKESAREHNRNKTRDRDRDQARDLDRDRARDLDRDRARDRDRDHDRDQAHDLERDQNRDRESRL